MNINMNICGNFAKEGQCGTCKHFSLVGVCMGVCCADERYETKFNADECDCDLYLKGKPELLP